MINDPILLQGMKNTFEGCSPHPCRPPKGGGSCTPAQRVLAWAVGAGLILSSLCLVIGCRNSGIETAERRDLGPPVVSVLPASPVVSDADREPVRQNVLNQAVEQIISSSRSENPFLRANAIEAAQALPNRIMQLVQLGLGDPNPVVRFVAVVTVGQKKLHALIEPVKVLQNDPSPSVQAAVILALRQCGHNVTLRPLMSMLQEPDGTLRANVAVLLGRLGQPSDIQILMDLARQPPVPQMEPIEHAIVKIQIAEAMVVLGDESQRQTIRAGAYSSYDEVRVMAVQMMGKLADRAFRGALVHMLQRQPVRQRRPIEQRLAAAEALARLGDGQGLSTVVEGCQFASIPVRAQATLALTWFDQVPARKLRAQMLADPSEQVRLAASAAIVHADRESGSMAGVELGR